ncbi:MAG TPA: hypothetical protein VHY91_10925 [Pirellulales bacterium]|jgi:hypothetical protein|nr:hypothetical protein [Pirellulales bacterium]
MTTPVAGNASQPGDHDRRPTGGQGAAGDFVAYDQFIDSQLHTARRQVRTVDIAVSLTTLAAGTLGFFLLAALCDHWLFSGGLGTAGRWLALTVYLASALAWCWHSLLPLCIHRINPVYAAYTIERSKPTLKNSLINFLLLRAKPAGLAPHVYDAIEQHAATELAQVPVESAIDRSKLIKIGYVFLGLVLLAAIYKVSSPKDPFQTFGRIVLPWADIAPPTRVTIVEVRPGNSTLMRGQRTKISAQVQGIAGRQPVRLVYSTDDGQVVDRAVPMQVPTEGYLFECDFPEGRGGIQQDVNYRVVAGDATSTEFRLTVQAAPTIVVESVDYAYPGYTGMVGQTVDHQGDLKAIEGTQVTLHALANQSIKSAAIDFDSNGSADQRMTFDDRHATATFTLALKADRQTPEHASYQLRFTNAEGNENPQPIRHQIEVTRDVSPEIQFLAPKRDEIELPLNAPLPCEVSAHDPDFALARVALVGQTAAGQPFERSLLEESSKNGQPWQGQFHKKLTLVPQKLGLKVGDVLEYWAWAEDDKTPAANRSETIHRRARIISPTAGNDSPDALARGDQESADKPSGDRSSGDQQEKGQPDSTDDENASDQPSDSPPGADRERGQKPKRDGDAPPNSDPKADQQPDQGDSMPDRPSDKPNRDAADQAGDKSGQAGDERSQQEQTGQEQTGQEQSGQEQAGDEQSGEGSKGKGKSGNAKAGKNQSGSDSTGENGSDSGDSGNSSSTDEQQAGDGQGGKAAAKNRQGSKNTRGAKHQPVAKDGTQDGEAFDEIIERQNEQEPGDSQTGARRTTTRRGSTPPTAGTPNEQNPEQESGDQQPGDQNAGDQKSGEQNKGEGQAQRKQTTAKEGAKKSSDHAGGSKQPGDDANSGDKKPDDRSGSESGEKSADGEKQQPQDSAKGKKDASGRPDDKMPATDRPNDRGDGAADEKPTADSKQPADGQPSAAERTPDGKPMTQNGDGQQKDGSSGAGQSGADPRGQTKEGQPGSGNQASKTPDAEERSAEKQTAGKKTPGKQDADNPASNGQSESDGPAEKSPTDAKPDKTAMPQKGGDEAKNQTDNPAESPDGDRTGQSNAEHGAQPPGKSGQKAAQKPADSGQPEGKSGQGQQDQGDSGAGQNSANDQQGSPKPQGENRPTKKSHGQSNKPDANHEKSGSPPSPSGSDRQSDSEGKPEGDRSGGGKQGGGQKSQQAGPGGPGDHSAADEGGETAPDQDGPSTSDQPGSDRQSQKPTGQPGQKPGSGSKTGAQPGDRSKSADGKSGGRNKPADDKGSGANQPAEGDGDGADKPAADGRTGTSPAGNRGKAGPGQGGGNTADSQQTEPPPTAPEKADEANLEFTRKAADLTIQRLRDQLAKGQVDQELLDRLQWSQQDMENWVRRWEEMFRRSEQQGKAGQAARAELDATLRSLGLRPHGAVVAGHRRDDTARGMKEGRRTQPPAEYRDQVRQYLQGVSRTQNGAATGRDGKAPRPAAAAASGNEK